MNNIQNIISKALATWSTKHATSTVKCQGIYFSIMIRTAEKNGFDSPCQELYDIFLNKATTSATYFSRTQVIKAVDLEAGTHAINKDGCFYNEPAFPTFADASHLLSSLEYPIVEPLDISIIIAYAAGVIK